KEPEGTKSPGAGAGGADGAGGGGEADGGDGKPTGTAGLVVVGAVVLVWLGLRKGRRGAK
ncbi:WD40 repeat domain-containing protein, partial [Streptomyces sp. McG2]|nr:WD40 repeat domain-containing protein [Streptomyces sp. McG2]